MDPILLTTTLAPYIHLALAALFGALIGVERTLAGKSAGMRTYALVALGAALFVVACSLAQIQMMNFSLAPDPFKVVSGIITGVGFIGAGLIFSREDALHGLTSAAGLWIAAGVGVACGYGLYILALFVTLLTIFVFTGLWIIENWLKRFLAYSQSSTRLPNQHTQQ